MARGKHASQAAKARADKAEQQFAELKGTLQAERSAWKQERADLLNEVQRLQNKTRSEIDAAAAEAIREARENFQAEITAERKKWQQKAEEAARFLDTHEVLMTMDDHLNLANILGVEPWGFSPENKHPRHLRRATPKQAIRNENRLKELEQRGIVLRSRPTDAREGVVE